MSERRKAFLLFDDDIKVNAHVAARMRFAWYRPTWRIRGGTAAFEANSGFFPLERRARSSNVSTAVHAALRRFSSSAARRLRSIGTASQNLPSPIQIQTHW
jgi:hypothetical protein